MMPGVGTAPGMGAVVMGGCHPRRMGLQEQEKYD